MCLIVRAVRPPIGVLDSSGLQGLVRRCLDHPVVMLGSRLAWATVCAVSFAAVTGGKVGGGMCA